MRNIQVLLLVLFIVLLLDHFSGGAGSSSQYNWHGQDTQQTNIEFPNFRDAQNLYYPYGWSDADIHAAVLRKEISILDPNYGPPVSPALGKTGSSSKNHRQKDNKKGKQKLEIQSKRRPKHPSPPSSDHSPEHNYLQDFDNLPDLSNDIREPSALRIFKDEQDTYNYYARRGHGKEEVDHWIEDGRIPVVTYARDNVQHDGLGLNKALKNLRIKNDNDVNEASTARLPARRDSKKFVKNLFGLMKSKGH